MEGKLKQGRQLTKAGSVLEDFLQVERHSSRSTNNAVTVYSETVTCWTVFYELQIFLQYVHKSAVHLRPPRMANPPPNVGYASI